MSDGAPGARSATRSLVVAPQWIGDAVMAEPLLATLAERGETLTVAALPWVAPVFAAIPAVQETIELPFAHGRLDWSARRRVATALRGRFDVAYVLPNSLKAALVPWLARIPRRVGYRGEARAALLTDALDRPRGRPPMVPFYGALAGVAFDVARRPRLALARERIDAAAATHSLVPSSYWTFAPGAEYGPAKRWPADRYAALARALHARDGASIVLLGSPQEAALCEEIAAQSVGACRVVAGKATLLDAIALIAGSRGLASNDSGLMHVAAGFGLPQVAVFGSTSPLHTPPLNDRARVLWLKDELDLDCMPCFDRSCRFGHYRCLTAVESTRALAALDSAQGPPTAAASPSRREGSEAGREQS